MRTSTLFLLSLLLVEAASASQRLTEIRPGDPCGRIPEIEMRLGSLDAVGDDTKGTLRYSGIHGGKEATIHYRCTQGFLDRHTILVTTATREEALRFANQQKEEISRNMGDPIHDGLELSTWRRLLFGFLGADLDYLTRVVVWGRAKEDTMLSVTELDDQRWEISISQGTSKSEYIFNS